MYPTSTKKVDKKNLQFRITLSGARYGLPFSEA